MLGLLTSDSQREVSCGLPRYGVGRTLSAKRMARGIHHHFALVDVLSLAIAHGFHYAGRF